MADSPFVFTDFQEQLDYLKQRGIDKFTIKRLGLEVKTATWLKEQGFPQVPGLSRGIVWFLRDVNGEVTGKLGARVFYAKGILEVDKPKFLPPKGQVPGLYFSPLADWDKLEYGQRILVCESYLKADIAALCGFHAVGVSGCWGWSIDKKLNWDFHTIPWELQGLEPVICMDSNVQPENGRLWQAARRFSATMEVEVRTAASIIILPPGRDSDWGLDDYYFMYGKDKTSELLGGEAELLVSAMTDHLTIMNTQVVVVRDIHRIAEIDTGLLMRKGDFEGVNYANRIVWNDDNKPQSVAKAWISWKLRNEVNEVVYKPGEPRLTEQFYNLWEGMGCQPLAADVSLYTGWINDVFDSQTEREFFLDWWAWQLQNLGGKLMTGLVIVGPAGIGKGWIADIMQRIFGRKNVGKAPLTVLERPFNADIAAKQLFIVEETDEISRSGGAGQRVYNNLKDMITSTTIRLERKGVDAQLIDNCLNVFLTGNQVGIFKLDAGDRRFAVLECIENSPGEVANNPEYWDQRWEWVANGGAEAIYGYLLNRDLTEFNPNAMAPMTDAKHDMVELTHDSLELWVADLLNDPEGTLQVGGSEVDGSVATARELMWIYLRGRVPMVDIDRNMATKMNRALKNARLNVANNGGKIKAASGVASTYFIVRDLPKIIPAWSALVNDRLFWLRLVASENGKVASEHNASNLEQNKKY